MGEVFMGASSGGGGQWNVKKITIPKGTHLEAWAIDKTIIEDYSFAIVLYPKGSQTSGTAMALSIKDVVGIGMSNPISYISTTSDASLQNQANYGSFKICANDQKIYYQLYTTDSYYHYLKEDISFGIAWM